MADTVDIHIEHRTLDELRAGLDEVRSASKVGGRLELIVARPAVDQRAELAIAELDVERGLVADRWSRGTKPNPNSQVTVMNVRATRLAAGDRSRWALAGDQLYVDLDLSRDNIPPGTRLEIGAAMLEVSEQPHLGCEKFAARFGVDARAFFNSPDGTALGLRGINARVLRGGTVRVGDTVHKLPREDGGQP